MNHTVLITGAARGIGEAIARSFLREGCNVVINFNHSEAKARSLFAELTMSGFDPDKILLVKADVSQADQVQQMVEKTLKKFGKIDILVNNAGIANSKIITQQSEAEWDEIFNINVKGAFLCCREVLPGMINRKSGVIINISSIWGQVGASCEVSYSATKGAIDAFTKALAKEVGPSGIRVNAVAPGVINTDMNAGLSPEELQALADNTPLGTIGSPYDIARAVLYLSSPDAKFITGHILAVNGGFVV